MSFEDEVRITLRLPEDLRDAIADAGREVGRSLNSEIVQRLRLSLEPKFPVAGASFEDQDGNFYVRTDPLLVGDINIENAITTVRMALDDLHHLVKLAREGEAAANSSKKP